MNRKKSLGVLIILLLGLFLLAGCGNNTEDGVIEANGGTVVLEAKDNDTTIAEGNSTVLTATVTVTRKDSKGVYVTDHYPGQAVTFVIISNNSGGAVTPMNGGITNAAGVASAVYTAGKLKKGLVVQDTIQAHIAGYSGQIVITRTGVESGYTITMTAEPTSVAAGENSVVTATVTATDPEGGTSVPVSGQIVNFLLVLNSSGGYLSIMNAVTDAAGKATATYTAGNNYASTQVTDTIQASSGGSSAAVVITRTGGAAGYTIEIKAEPTALASHNGQSAATATVKNSAGKAVRGVSVTFSVVAGTSGGSVTPETAITDGNGNAVATFTGAAGSVPAVDTTATVQASIMGGTYSAAVVITNPKP